MSYVEEGGDAQYFGPLNEHFKFTPLAQIDQPAIYKAARILYPGRANSTINRQVYTPVSAVKKHGARQGLCDWVPIKRPEQPKPRNRWLQPDEAERLIEAAANHLRPLLEFMFGTGARVSEALYLDWAQVDVSRAHVTFINADWQDKRTKSGEDRGVPLHPRVVAALANLPHRDGAVFRRPDGKPYERPKQKRGGQIKKAFGTARQRAGIENFKPHDCRHTWASWHYMANRDVLALKELGGWKTLKMVERYAHVNRDDLRVGIDKLPWEIPGELYSDDRKNIGKTA